MNADSKLQATFEVSNVLGCGSLEKVYERALLTELALQGIRAKTQVSYPVIYKGQCIGEYFADLIVEDEIVLELKCVDHLLNEHTAQCLNYLKASGHKRYCLPFSGSWHGIALSPVAVSPQIRRVRGGGGKFGVSGRQ